MKNNADNNRESVEIQSSIIHRDKQENFATASLTSETLSKLNISIRILPQRCQQILEAVTNVQSAIGVTELDPIAISLNQTRQFTQNIEDDYEILELRQKNEELQRRIDGNAKFLENLRRELEWSRESLANQSPGPGDIQDYIKQIKQKMVSYEESCERAKTKLAKLSIPDALMPKSLNSLVSSLQDLNEEACSLRQRSDDITLARTAVENLNRLRR